MMDGWMDGWMDGVIDRLIDCLGSAEKIFLKKSWHHFLQGSSLSAVFSSVVFFPMERQVVAKILEVGMVVDRKRHSKCWKTLQQHFLQGDRATLQPVDTDIMMSMRQKMADRVETRVLIDNVFSEPRAEFTIYVFHGVTVSNLHLLRTADHTWGAEMLWRALNDFRLLVQHPAEIPEVVVYACQALDHQWYPSLHFPALQWSGDLEAFIPWLSPEVSMWSDTLVPSRYAYYVRTRTERDVLEHLQAYLDLSQETPQDTALPPPPMLIAPLDNRIDLAKRRSKEHMAVQSIMARVLEAADVDMDLFYEAINRAFAIQLSMEERTRIDETAASLQSMRIEQQQQQQQHQQQEFDLSLEKAFSEKSEGNICPEEDAISRQLYSNLAWNMGSKPLVEIMTEKQGAVERYSASSKSMRPYTTIQSSYQLSAALFATINLILCRIKERGVAEARVYCERCKDLRNTYRRLRTLLVAFPGGRPDVDRSFLRADKCAACAVILCLSSAVLCLNYEWPPAERARVVDKYLVHLLGWPLLDGLSVDTVFLQAMTFFRYMDEAVDQQRRPWSFRYDYHPVRWREEDDGMTASLRHSPTVCCDESLTVTALVLRSLTKMGAIGVDLYRNEMRFTNADQKRVVDQCFTPCIDFFMDQSTVTATTKAKVRISRSEVGVCVDRTRWEDANVLEHRPSAADRHYLYTESLCEHIDALAITGKGLLRTTTTTTTTNATASYVGLEDLRYEYTLAWPLMVRNFLHGSEDSAAAGGDLRLYYSVYGLQKMLFSKWTRGHNSGHQTTMVAPICSSGVSVKIYTILPELLTKILHAYPCDTHIFDLLAEPLLMAARKIDGPLLAEGETVSVKITADATWTLYTALWAFVHALSGRLIIIDTVLERLYETFKRTRPLREAHPEAARLCAYLYRQKDKCRKDGYFHVPNPFYSKHSNTAVDAAIQEICGNSSVPPHHLLYRAVLNAHVAPELARDVFLGISSRLHWRSRPGLSVSLAYFADPCASTKARQAEDVLASLRMARTIYEKHTTDTVQFDADENDTSYSTLSELFASLEVLTRFPATICEEDRLDIVENRWRLDGPIDVDRVSTYRGLLTRNKVLALTMFTNHSAVVCSRSIPLLGAWIGATPWNVEDRPLAASEVMPVWHPMLLPSRIDHYRLLNVVRGSGELAPFAGAHEDFLMAVITEPIEAVTIPPASDFGMSLMQSRVYGMTDLEAEQWKRQQIANAFFEGQDLVPVPLESERVGYKRSRSGDSTETPSKLARSSSPSPSSSSASASASASSSSSSTFLEDASIGQRLRRLRESGQGPSVIFIPRRNIITEQRAR